MTSVNVTTNKNTITVQEGDATTVTVSTQGPQGATGAAGPASIDIEDSAKINKSVIYYDATAGQYKADSTWTTTSLVDGGNF